MSSKLFALDIGTRSVVGIILDDRGDSYHVEDLVSVEHKDRSMLDGQIHNVLSVAEVITSIKEELEARHGTLRRVSVAAAGRALKTSKAMVTFNISNRALLTEEDINRLELGAVQKAQQELLKKELEQRNTYYYCVGYSVLYYKLDNEIIGSLVDQSGNEASAEVIATFLPRVVVESLLSALKRSGLEMEALTLEPIAAINVLIPPSMRRLNVALVDIGAGTSDIAITDQNTVVAYGMVPTAGDEITEALSDHFLLDFPIAESVKRKINSEEIIHIADILGFEREVPQSEAVSAIRPAVQNLATSISSEILALNNGKSPMAVMLVGGGSLTPELSKELSIQLGLPENRVATRGLDAIQNLTKEDQIPSSPELVTPIGIAIAAKRAPIHYMSVTVNDKLIRLFELKDLTVADALLAANVKAKQLYGKPGLAMSITINGNPKLFPGEHGTPAEIFLNGEPASTKSIIHDGDILTLIEGKDGKDAKVYVKDIVQASSFMSVYVLGEKVEIAPIVSVNGEIANMDFKLSDRDSLDYQAANTVADILAASGKDAIWETMKPFSISFNGKSITLPEYAPNLLLNDQNTDGKAVVIDGDCLVYEKPADPTVKDICEKMNMKLSELITVTFQGEPLKLKRTICEVFLNGHPSEEHDRVRSGDLLNVSPTETDPLLFQDIFRFTDWTLPTTISGSFKLLRNGEETGFQSPIFGGDQLEIVFE
ncbi:cell division protein FtsA [Chungangia koreensis]|uniref:Cell division protein FtsA n=1 Tax=Chungangia koreensis TaxID=752657 RepID=A0ABV8X382_9LACT